MSQSNYARFFTIDGKMQWSGHTRERLKEIYKRDAPKLNVDELEQLEWMLRAKWDADKLDWVDTDNLPRLDVGDFILIHDCAIVFKPL